MGIYTCAHAPCLKNNQSKNEKAKSKNAMHGILHGHAAQAAYRGDSLAGINSGILGHYSGIHVQLFSAIPGTVP